MRPEERDRAYLVDMAVACRHAIEYLALLDVSPEPPSEVVLEALHLQLITLGEASRRVSPELKRRYPEVSWRGLISLRNVFVHDYDKVDEDEVRRTVRDDLPGLLRQLEALLGGLP